MSYYPAMSSPTNLGVGLFNTSQFTTTNGTVSLISYSTKLSTGSISSAVTSYTISLTGSYPIYIIRFISLIPTGATAYPTIQLSTNGGSSFISGYSYRIAPNTTGSGTTDPLVSSQTTATPVSGEFYLFNPSNSSSVKVFYAQYSNNSSSSTNRTPYGYSGGTSSSVGAVNAVSFSVPSGTLTGGTLILYGISGA